MCKYNLGFKRSLVNTRWLFAIMWGGSGRVSGGGNSGSNSGCGGCNCCLL